MKIIAIEKEANSTFYNGNGIKEGRIISIDGIEVLDDTVISFLINFTNPFVPRVSLFEGGIRD